MPSRTSGKHFAAVLSCPQRAWLEYHDHTGRVTPPPKFLHSMQQEGITIEKEIYAAHYPDAVKIPERLSFEDRAERTLSAMRSGAGAILQGVLLGEDAIGILDVLEHVCAANDSPIGHRYRVGEIKRAKALGTAHVFQALWYDELLSQQQRGSVGDVLFHLGDGRRHIVSVAEAQSSYEQCKAALWSIRDLATEPGAHLCRDCRTCPWRGVCLPALEASSHLSLLPNVSRALAEQLRNAGARTWQDVLRARPEFWRSADLESREVARLSRAAQQLQSGAAVLRFPINTGTLQNWTVVTFDFPESAASSGESRFSEPTAFWHEDDDGPRKIRLSSTLAGSASQQLGNILSSGSFAVYGAGDAIALQRLAVQHGLSRRPPCMNVVDLLEDCVHAPLLGMELHQVVGHFHSKEPDISTGNGRIEAVRAVLRWISGATAV